jgi:formate hydrogenlyase subunit 3/multisubunit Na+/H+ antiporter MnhD subunit
VNHLVVTPIVLPLVAGALCALLGTRAPRLTAALSLAATLGLLATAILLLRQASGGAVQPCSATGMRPSASRWRSTACRR